MKLITPIITILVLQATAGLSIGDERSRLAFTERPTDAGLENVKRKPAFTGIASAERPAARSRSFNEMSDFIAFDGFTTFVPKGAIMHKPEQYRQNVVDAPTGELVLWRDFYTRNRARIAMLEVTLEEASGAAPIDPKRLGAAMKSGHIVVSVIRGLPTSVSVKKQEPSSPTAK